MGPRSTSKKNEQMPIIVEDPLVLEMSQTADKWTDCTTENNKMILHVQHLLGSLSHQVEECNKELASIYEDAQLLTALRISEYRQKKDPSSLVQSLKKQRPKRESSVKVLAQQPVDENSTEALVAAMDDKKRLKVSSTLLNLFKRGCTDSPSQLNLAPGAARGSIAPASAEASAPPHCNSPATPSDPIPQACGIPNVGLPSSSSFSSADRRPRDVPPELWEEVSNLRLRRIVLEERLAMLTRNIDAQLARFDLLVQNHSIASYATDAMDCILRAVRQKKS